MKMIDMQLRFWLSVIHLSHPHPLHIPSQPNDPLQLLEKNLGKARVSWGGTMLHRDHVGIYRGHISLFITNSPS